MRVLLCVLIRMIILLARTQVFDWDQRQSGMSHGQEPTTSYMLPEGVLSCKLSEACVIPSRSSSVNIIDPATRIDGSFDSYLLVARHARAMTK